MAGWGAVDAHERLSAWAKANLVAAKLLAENSKGRYWIARTLARTGELMEQEGKFEDAKRAWSLILETKLGWESLARAGLARLGVPEIKP